MAKKKKRGRPPNPNKYEIYEELKRQKKLKRIIKPGLWSELEPGFTVVAKLKKTESCSYFPKTLGKYITHDDGYSGDGYRAKVKVIVDNLPFLIKTHGIDKVLAACEKSLNSYKYKSGKKVLGNLVIDELLYDEKSKREHYLPCLIKTSKRHLPKFMGTKKGVLQVF